MNDIDWLYKVPENGQEETEHFQERRMQLTTLVAKVVLRKSGVPEMEF
jgi:hypothetical protein